MEKFEVNIPALIDELKNQTAKNLILHFIDDKSIRAYMQQLFDVFSQHGVNALVAVEIIQDIAKLTPPKPEGNNGTDIEFH